MHYYSKSGIKPKRSKKKLLVALIALLALAGIGYWFFARNDKTDTQTNQSEQKSSESSESAENAYQPVDLQPVIDQWVNKYPADYHIAVYDLQAGKTIGQKSPETVLFAASLYKIYVAYLSLIDFQDGAQNPDEVIVAGQTKRECIDKMIRSSDSPCGEAMMAEMGQTSLNKRVSEMGMMGTFFNGIRTSAQDSALILQKIAESKDLNQENTAFLLDAMLTQEAKFKRGLQTGAPEATWNTKVGWNEDTNYHDIGIMTLPDGRKFAVAILGQGSGSPAPIADFASTIYSALATGQ